MGYALGARNEDGAFATFYPRMPGNSTLKPCEKVLDLSRGTGSVVFFRVVCYVQTSGPSACRIANGNAFHLYVYPNGS